MQDTDVLYDKRRHAAYLTLNRPDKLNALSFEMFDRLVARLREAEADDDVKVVVLSGNGASFCSGHDLSHVGYVYGFGDGRAEGGRRRPSQRARLRFDRHLLENYGAFLYAQKPVIAQVHGYCVGAGAHLVEACDLAIAAEDAKIGHPEQRFGFSGTAFLLTSEILHLGPKKAREMLLLGDLIDGREAERIGFVNKAVAPEALADAVEAWVEKIRLLPKDGIAIGRAYHQLAMDSLGATTQLIHGYWGHTLVTNIRYEPGEYNFFKERRDKGVREAVHERDAPFVQGDP